MLDLGAELPLYAPGSLYGLGLSMNIMSQFGNHWDLAEGWPNSYLPLLLERG